MLGMGTQGREMEKGKSEPGKGHSMGKGLVSGNSGTCRALVQFGCYQSVKLQAWSSER